MASLERNYSGSLKLMSGLLAMLAASLLCSVSMGAQAEGARYGAAMNYQLHCEGCHKPDGSGQPGFIPAFRGSVARFLATDEGRTYLARVPGTAQSLLSDVERAEVLTWIVMTFDPGHLPSDFVPYTASELAKWRYDALSQPSLVRAQLISQVESASEAVVVEQKSSSKTSTSSAPVKPPAAFTICSVCHTVSADGGNGVGPNLHGIVERGVGSASDFSYSSAIRRTEFTWTTEKLDEFLKSPAAIIPGNFMTLGGIQSAEERKSIIDYLSTLR